MSKIEYIDKDLSITFDFIKKLFEPRYYEASFDHVAIDKSVVKTEFTNEGFYFELAKMILTSPEDTEKLFERDNEIIIFRDFYNKIYFKINDCNKFKISVGFNGSTNVNGFIKNFETNHLEEYKNSFYRAVIPTNCDFIPSKYFKLEKSLKSREIFSGTGIIEIVINEIPLHLYMCDDNNKKYFIIETLEKSAYENFKNIIDEIILSITYLTGYFLGNNVIFIGSNDLSYKIIKLLGIKNFFDELKESFPIIPDLHFYRDFVGNLVDFTKQEYLKLVVEKCFSNLVYKRTILLICQAHSEPIYVQASLYSVALETITNLISELLETKNKPIQDKKVAKKLRDELKKVLSNFKENISDEAFNKIDGDFERLNSLTNKQKLLLPFEYYNYKLDTNLIEAINRRNDFLHGRIPENSDKHFLSIIVGRLLFCVNILTLKYIGFEGYIYQPSVMYQFNNSLEIDDDVLKLI